MNNRGRVASSLFEREGFHLAVIKEISTVASVAMPLGENWTVSRCRYSPEDGGNGRLCIATGVHGDEMMGQLVIYAIAQRIMKEPEHLHGVVDMYPMLNPIGLDMGERLVPFSTRLDMNRAFPGIPDGTPLEAMCYSIMQDMLGADLVLDIHAGTMKKSELYEVRMHEKTAEQMLPGVADLCPQLIWYVPDKPAFNATLTGALNTAGTPALVLEADERRRRPYVTTPAVIEGIFCKMKAMGIWSGETIAPKKLEEIPTVHSDEELCRVSATKPGVYVPENCTGREVERGQLLGIIIDALRGEKVEEIIAPAAGLVFSQRSYSAVYPGTLLARLCRKERV